MSSSEHFVIGDWGTTALRASLCDARKIIATAEGPGVSKFDESANTALKHTLSAWTSSYDIRCGYMCGMVGSEMGLLEVPHDRCPISWFDVGRNPGHVTIDGIEIAIVPGLKCTSPVGGTDLLRGEETQLLGVLHAHEKLRTASNEQRRSTLETFSCRRGFGRIARRDEDRCRWRHRCEWIQRMVARVRYRFADIQTRHDR